MIVSVQNKITFLLKIGDLMWGSDVIWIHVYSFLCSIPRLFRKWFYNTGTCILTWSMVSWQGITSGGADKVVRRWSLKAGGGAGTTTHAHTHTPMNHRPHRDHSTHSRYLLTCESHFWLKTVHLIFQPGLSFQNDIILGLNFLECTLKLEVRLVSQLSYSK